MAQYNILIEKDNDGYYISEVLELPGCHTQAKSLDELMERTKEAIQLYLEVEDALPVDKINFIGLQKLEI